MCNCPAHFDLVDCTCRCDHTADRMLQWRARADALAATVQRVEALCKQWEGAAAADIGLDFQGPFRIGPIARALRSALAPSDPATDTGGEGHG